MSCGRSAASLRLTGCAGLVAGWLRLTVVGIVVVTLVQGICIILVAAHLPRGGVNGRHI